jgi:hypothetical protein
MIKINDENRQNIIDQYLNILMQDIVEEMPKYRLYNYAMNFVLEEKTSMSIQDLEAEILSGYPDLLYKHNNKLNDENRLEVINEYANAIISEFATEIPKYTLFDYARSFLLSEIKLLSNEYLEKEISQAHPELLEKDSK